jgi:Methyltransferase FkbM domain
MRTSQTQNRGLKHHLKEFLLPSGLAPRTIRGGILSGVAMELDFANHTQRWLGLQERELNGWFQRLSKGICTAIDVGANDGMYTLYFLAKSPARKVFAFEPAEDSLALMRKNLALNGFEGDPRVEIVMRTVGTAVNGQDVDLDSFLNTIQFPCLIKVDIDGGELSLLHGARRLLASRDVRWVIEVHSVELQEKCLEVLHAANYRTFTVRNAWWRHILPELRPGELNQWIIGIPQKFV